MAPKRAAGAGRPAAKPRLAGPPKRKFTGKCLVGKDGVKALDRKFTDLKAWQERRRKEEPPPGGWPKPPKHWPPGVRVDLGRPVSWLPPGWGQGVKTTCASKLLCYISPEGGCYYHKHVVAKVSGKDLSKIERTEEATLEWARKRAHIAVVQGTFFNRRAPKPGRDERLFATLEKRERQFLPKSADDLYFAVVSARRADNESGLQNICMVEARLRAAGAKPVWYVDAPSLASYKALGLTCKVGGKLVPARNMALRDAARLRKPCVQVSDDIQGWDYYVGDMGKAGDIFAGNDAARKADRIRLSPVGAARFLLAKMRAAAHAAEDGGPAPRLAGVFPLGNLGQAFCKEPVSYDNFILGDFFVADPSPVRFDPRFQLKEDYDYTCAHLARHGMVLRCNRMIVHAIHERNAGGACSVRDSSGDRERQMIKLLQEKWPRVFWINPKRGDTQVIMSWKRRKVA